MNGIKPILFNTYMVRSILSGLKTETRRPIKPRPNGIDIFLPFWVDGGPTPKCETHHPQVVVPQYCPNDVLWVRETFCNIPVHPDGELCTGGKYYYKADGDIRPDGWRGNWKPSIHMPKEAARLFLRVKNVRAERVQDITAQGIRNEGLKSAGVHAGDMELAIPEWIKLWDSTIPHPYHRAYGWSANPWVWVIEFERCEKPDGWEV